MLRLKTRMTEQGALSKTETTSEAMSDETYLMENEITLFDVLNLIVIYV